MSGAEIGTRILQHRAALHAARAEHAHAPAPPPDRRDDAGGFVPPFPVGPAPELAQIQTDVRALDVKATSLLRDYQANVAEADASRKAYEDWFQNVWKPFFDKTTGFFGPFSNILHVDELRGEVAARRAELSGFDARYQTLRTPGGQPVPPPSMPLPPAAQPTPPPSGPSSKPSWWPTFSIPAWVWVLGGVALAGGAWYAVQVWRRARADEAMLRGVVFDRLGFTRSAPAAPMLAPARDEVVIVEDKPVEAPAAASTCSSCGHAPNGGG